MPRAKSDDLVAKRDADGKGVLSRYVRILDAVASSGSGLSLTEITRDADLSKGTTHRLVNALREVGYLSTANGSKNYQVGPALVRLLHFTQSPATVSSLAQPALRQLVRKFGETAFVARLNGRMVESITVEIPERQSSSHVQPGRLMPVNSAASAKAIFAFQPAGVLGKVLEEPLRRFTPKTIVDRSKLRQELDKVKEQGFAVCSDELDPGVLSYACPIDIPGVSVLYSVGVVGLSARLNAFTEQEIVSAVRQAATAIGTRLQGDLTDHGQTERAAD